MRTLIIQLPPGLPHPSLAYRHALVLAEPNQRPLPLQWGVASLLPAADRQTETVALLPAAAVSWHRVSLPPGLQKNPARLQQALHGLLEDRLLDEPGQLHMALQADWRNAAQPWVAVCERAWLAAHLQALELAGLPVHRIVPELQPPPDGAPAQISALGEDNKGWLWFGQAERGVWGLPLQSLRPAGPIKASDCGLSEDELQSADFQAEPGVVALASECMAQNARLMPPGQHWLAAIASDWDLAQFDLRANAQTRRLKNWQRAASVLAHSPAWRPTRWGLWLLLGSQLLGLNVWAWQTRAQWQAQQNSWAVQLRSSFPATTLVIDAPLQMAQQVERLRQSSGQLGAGDLEAMLAALGQAMPPGLAAASQWTYQPGQLRLQNFKPDAAQSQSLQQSLATGGYTWRAEGQAWLMNAPTAEAKP